MRKPNTQCCICSQPTYKRPNDLRRYKKAYCGIECYRIDRSISERECEACGQLFKPWNRKGRFCNKSCANKGRIGTHYNQHKFPGRSANERRLNELKATFKFDSCMVEGCSYSFTYDVHRLIPGKDGGEYILGNMFAICPNHHAEIHRKIIELVRVSDSQLRIIRK